MVDQNSVIGTALGTFELKLYSHGHTSHQHIWIASCISNHQGYRPSRRSTSIAREVAKLSALSALALLNLTELRYVRITLVILVTVMAA